MCSQLLCCTKAVFSKRVTFYNLTLSGRMSRIRDKLNSLRNTVVTKSGRGKM